MKRKLALVAVAIALVFLRYSADSSALVIADPSRTASVMLSWHGAVAVGFSHACAGIDRGHPWADGRCGE